MKTIICGIKDSLQGRGYSFLKTLAIDREGTCFPLELVHSDQVAVATKKYFEK
ncbi:MAG: hypothetical protein ACFFD4_03285 [Candidatus Odinarchaeota archaeon]